NHFWNGIFQGMIWVLILYHFLLYLSLKERSYLYYCLYMLCISALTLGDFGYWQTGFFADRPVLGWHLFLLAQFVTGVMTLVFMRSFVELDRLSPQWDRITHWFILGSSSIIGLLAIYYFPTGDGTVLQLAKALIIPFAAFGLLLCFVLLRTGDVVARYFAVAGAVMAITVAINAYFELFQKANHPGTDFQRFYFIQATVVVHLLTFALGMGYRRRQKDREWQRTKELDDLKTRFYTNITHEFRTPLTVILGMNEQIKGHSKEKKLIHRNAQQLLRLINKLLGLSRLEAGQLQPHWMHGDIVSYCQYLTESFHSLATDKNIGLTFYAEENDLFTSYDENKLQHIINNLLSNAIKFTEEGGKVILHLSRAVKKGKPYFKIKVQDTGIGIAPNDLPHVFDRFYQTDASHTRPGEGTGIGLAYVRELVRLLEGEILVNSQLDKGTTFQVWLPIQQKESHQAANQPSVPPVTPVLAEMTPISVVDQEEQHPKQDDRPVLLLVEDNADVASYIHGLLATNYRVEMARNGLLGVEKAYELVPDIIISDIMMPEMDGYELCATLKADERTSHVPIILLTAKVTQKDKIEGLAKGADAFLTKPFEKEELFIRLEKLIALRAALQKRYANYLVAPEKLPPAKPGPEDIFLQKLEAAVEERLTDPNFSVPELALSVQLSQMQVYRKLKAVIGKTPSQFIRFIRLRKSKELLADASLNISEVAYDVGFADPNYFSRTFSNEFGVSPSEYREKIGM
ncbi:MAG: ATP-binding protein, partial [Bacteroidota bacterium]